MVCALCGAARGEAQPPAASPARPVACVYDRLDRSYINRVWLAMAGNGIAIEDPMLRDFAAAGLACERQLGWGDRQSAAAGFHALLRARGETMLAEKVGDAADRAALTVAIRRYADANHAQLVERMQARQFFDPALADSPRAARARADFTSFLERTNPGLLRRIDSADLWTVAAPALGSEMFGWLFGQVPAGT